MASADGLSPDDVQRFEERAETAAVSLVRRIITAVLRALGQAPAPSAVDPVDTAAVANTMWVQQAPAEIMPVVTDVWAAAAAATAADFLAAGVPTTILGPDRGAAYLTEASNRLVGLGDTIWEAIATQLAAGMDVGESIPEMAARIQAVAPVAEARATTIARTEVIAASNAGSFAQAQVLADPTMTKRWLATDDARTRETHRKADGQTVPLLAAFEVGGFPLMLPGDPTGPPEEVINCRCTVTYDFSTTDEGMLVAARDVVDDWAVVIDRGVLTADADEPHTGAMIALVPSVFDAERLEVGEPAGELHATLVYLGADADLTPAQRGAILDDAHTWSERQPILDLDGFAIATFNPTHPDRDTVVVLELSGDQGADLVRFRETVVNLAEHIIGSTMQPQHQPWYPHVTLAYTDDPTLAGQLTHLTGPIRFDALRVAFGGDVYDYPLRAPDDDVTWDVTVAAVKNAEFEGKHKRDGEGKFATMATRLANALAQHDGSGDPFAGFSREQLRREAVKQGVPLARGESPESISKKLQAKIGGGKSAPDAPAPKGDGKPSPDAPNADASPESKQARIYDLLLGDGDGAIQNPSARKLVEQMEAHGWEFTSHDSRYDVTQAKAPDGRTLTFQFLRDKKPKVRINQQDITYKKAMEHVVTPTPEAAPDAPNVERAAQRAGFTDLTGIDRNNDPSMQDLREAQRDGDKAKVAPARRPVKPLPARSAVIRKAVPTPDGDVSTPPKAPRAAKAPAPGFDGDAAAIDTALKDIRDQAVASRDPNGEKNAATYLDELKLTAPQLRALARDLDIHVPSSATKAGVRDRIVKNRVGARLAAEAVARPAPPVGERTSAAPTPPDGPSLRHGVLTPGQTQVTTIADSPLKEERRQGGTMGVTSLEEHEAGRIIRKDVATRPGSADVRDPDEQADAEQLAPLVAEAMGLRAPSVVRRGRHEIEMEHIDGKAGDADGPYASLSPELARSPDGQRMGILDVAINNHDRNMGNFIQTPDGRLVPIDHSMAFYDAPDAVGLPFPTERLDITESEAAAMRVRMEALRPEFERVGRGDWLDGTLERFDRIKFAPDPKPKVGKVDAARVKTLQTQLAALTAEVKPLRAETLELNVKEHNRGILNYKDQARHEELIRQVNELRAKAAPLSDELMELLRERDGTNLGSIDDPDSAHWEQAKKDSDGVPLVWSPSTDQAEVEAAQKTMDKYRERDHTTVINNEKLRAGDTSARTWERRVQRAVDTQQFKQDSVVYRGGAFQPDFLIQLRPGAVLTDKGFQSTATEEFEAASYSRVRTLYNTGTRPVIFEIRTRAGTPAGNAQYGEIVFGTGRSMRIISVTEKQPTKSYETQPTLIVVAEWI